MTTKGLQLIALAQAGQTSIQFTGFQVGAGDWGASPTLAQLQEATALRSSKGSFPISRSEYVNPATTKLTLVASNQSNTTGGYYVTEVGIFAKWTDNTSFLYAIYVTEQDKADWFPAYNSITPSSITYSVPITVANATTVSIDTSAAGIATEDEVLQLQADVADIKGFIGYSSNHIFGLEVDFVNKRFTRLAGAFGKTPGADFDGVHCFGGRRRCNVTDGGVVVAYYGDDAYTETGALEVAVTVGEVEYAIGTAVQVMVEQPKFYYKVVPLDLEEINEGDGAGYHARKLRYYVCDEPETGFKIHPAFVRDGVENDLIYLSAYEGSTYDVSESAYVTDDGGSVDFTASTGDMLASIAGAKPTSGLTNAGATRAGFRTLAENRGTGWEQQYAATASASQLLMMIEYGTLNMQSAIGLGVVSITDDSNYNCASLTGSTSSLGNASGRAASTVNTQGETSTTETADGKTAVTYRGEENFYGNIWQWLDGMNIKNPATFADGDITEHVYVADHSFTDDSEASPYVDTGIHPCYTTGGWIKAFGYSEDFDWLFIPTQVGGGANSSVPVGDYLYNQNSGWRVARLGAQWGGGSKAGAFYLHLTDSSVDRHRHIGGRLVYIPSGSAA
ncbi:phage tail-collar fiber domain-containing protein [Oribacterium sp. C9]|uniref:phage tail-collar fiber domain-containing protein n=1 Tax=Oribacterium sp. C9 TaxID=1943579 RepID=UPI001FA8BF65|nr:phage tail protein [Oribacterium sp. C9]